MTDRELAAPQGAGCLPTGPRANPRSAAQLFEDWFTALTEATRKNYAQDLDAFASFLRATNRSSAAETLCASPLQDARSLVLRWRVALREKGEAPATINRRLSSLRSLFRHVVGVPLVVPSLKGARRRRVQNGALGTIAALLEAAHTGQGTKPLRDVALILTLHDSGLRRAEAATLRFQDLDLTARIAWVRGKGRQGEREAVDLSEPAALALRTYLDLRGPLAPESPVFATEDRAKKGSGALTPEGIRVLLASLCHRAGLPHVLAPHDLRRYGARALARAGADAELLRRWGRWADYRTPARYVGDVAEKGRQAVDLLAQLRQAAT